MPTLFIGLGSTGAKIVSRIKRRLDATTDDLTRQFYRYVRIHSETYPEPGVDEDIPGFVMATNELDVSTAVRAFQANQDKRVAEEFNKWWPRDPSDEKSPWVPPLTKLHRGVGGCRPIGRLLLHYANMTQGTSLLSAMQGIRREFKDTYAKLDAERRARPQDVRTNCYMFGLLAGGTCGGSLLDVAYLTRAGLGSVNLYAVLRHSLAEAQVT